MTTRTIILSKDLLEALWRAYHFSQSDQKPIHVFMFGVLYKKERRADYWFVSDEREPTQEDALGLLNERQRKEFVEGGMPHYRGTVEAWK